MNITLNDSEIKEALTQYVGNQGIDLRHKEVDISFTAGRGPNGYSASIEIVPVPNGSSTATASTGAAHSLSAAEVEDAVAIGTNTPESDLDIGGEEVSDSESLFDVNGS